MRYRLTGKGKLTSQSEMCQSQSQEFTSLLEQTLTCFPNLPYQAAGQHLNWMHRCLMYQFYIFRALMCSCHIRHKQQHWECTECQKSTTYAPFISQFSDRCSLGSFAVSILTFACYRLSSDNVWSRQPLLLVFFDEEWNNTFTVCFCAQRLKQQTWVNKEGLLPIMGF